MANKSEPTVCDFCKTGHISQRMREIAFRQWSDKGYVHCRASLMVGVCDHCQASAPAPGADKILDEAFRREYERLESQPLHRPTHKASYPDLGCAISAFLASATGSGGPRFRCAEG
jgi:hypothetical protein